MLDQVKIAFGLAALIALGSSLPARSASGTTQKASAKKTSKPPTKATLQPFPWKLTVMPQPQRTYSIAGKGFRFDNTTVLWAVEPQDKPGAEMLAADLKFRAGLVVPIVEGKSPKFKAGTRVVRFERNGATIKPPLQPALLQKLETTQAEGYCLLVDGTGIVVRGKDLRGVLYGAQTLRQLVRADLSVAPLAIQDWPEMPWRMLYGYYMGGLTTTEDVEKHIQKAVLAKANMIILESNWSGAGNWWYNPTGDRKVLADYFFNACRRYGIEPIPLVQGPGWGYGVTDLDAMTAEADWVKDEAAILSSTEPTALAKVNVVTTANAPIIVTDATTKTRYTEGKDYTVIPGNTSRPYDATNSPWKLQAVAGGAITDGTKVSVNYNAVTPNYHKAYCLSEPRSYEIVDRTLDYVMKTYNPPIIHIGHDELWEAATDSRCQQSGLTHAELVYKDLMHWYQKIKSHNPKTVIMVWDDLFRDAPAGEVTGPLKDFTPRIPKDIVLCPWYYYDKAGSKGDIEQRLQTQTKMGFPVIGVPSGYWMPNSMLWYDALQPYLKNGKSKGLMFTDWGEGLSAASLPASAELMWSGKTVDKTLFKQYEAVSHRLKDQSLGITYDYARPWQQEAITKFYNTSIKEGNSPASIAKQVKDEMIGDTSLFERAYGKEQWTNVAHDAPFTTQQASMLRKLPILFQLFADYFAAEALHQKGKADPARQKLQTIIGELHDIGYFSFDAKGQLLHKSQTAWLTPKELFDLELASPVAASTKATPQN
jgi:hypothetical protein